MFNFRLGYRPALDGLRGCAILAVMAHHTFLSFTWGGMIGVDVFFVLSGFLITSVLLEEYQREGRINLKKFYARRALRLLPALLLLLLLMEGFSLLFYRGENYWRIQRAILAALFYVGNWVRTQNITMGPLSHTWSLAVEEQFYFLWPPVLWWGLRRYGIGAVLLWAGFGIVLVNANRDLIWSGESSWPRIYNGFDTRLDELLAGCATACIVRLVSHRHIFIRCLRFAAPLAGSLLVYLVAFPLSDVALCRYGWPAIELATGILILYLVTSERTWLHRAFELSGLVWVGKISYGLYLWHYPIFERAGGFHLTRARAAIPAVIASFAAATMSYYLIELRFLKLKARLNRNEDAPAVPVVPQSA